MTRPRLAKACSKQHCEAYVRAGWNLKHQLPDEAGEPYEYMLEWTHPGEPEYPNMTRDHQHNPDPNQNAARIVRESVAGQQAAPADLEAAWAEWSRGVQKVDERGMTLLRAAFEAGFEAGRGQ